MLLSFMGESPLYIEDITPFPKDMDFIFEWQNISRVERRTSFYDFLKFSENFRKSSDVFGNIRKTSENFGSGSKVIFRWFYKF